MVGLVRIQENLNNGLLMFRVIYRLHDGRKDTLYKNYTKFDCLLNFKLHFGTENVTIIADNCSKNGLTTVKSMGFKNIIETALGNSGSFGKALDLALEYGKDDYIYFVEDDYLHTSKSKIILLEGLELATYVSLYDHPDKYGDRTPNPLVSNGGELTRVLLTKHCHWKETNSTTMTFATKGWVITETHEIFRKYLDTPVPQDYPMWRELLFNSSLVTPIPGYATHCHEPWITPFWGER